jgi:ribosomal protein S18 acetylase RimI-like enzyme
MEVRIRKAEPGDMPDVFRLILQLARYENAEEKVILSESELCRDSQLEFPPFHCVIACIESAVVGFCLSWYRYSTWRGRILYVEDFFVKPEFRRKGIGKMLLDEKLKMAKNQNISHIHLQVLDWNEPAIQFYRKYYNPEMDPEWINVLIPVSPETIG